MSKTLSNGTLSLRFMQNARNRQAKDVQLEKAHVEDDGQWEVAKEIRDSWGVSSAQTNQSVSQDSSYLPFLFPSASASTSSNVASTSTPYNSEYKGRRVFKKGREVKDLTYEKVTVPVAEQKEEDPSSNSRKGKKPTTLSRSESSGMFKPGKPIANSLPTAKLSIFDSSGVGTDLRSSNSGSKPKPPPPAPAATFMKPAGVDDPNEGAPAKDKKRGLTTEQGGPKRKKKKKDTD